jgi:hypothetical protein
MKKFEESTLRFKDNFYLQEVKIVRFPEYGKVTLSAIFSNGFFEVNVNYLHGESIPTIVDQEGNEI